MRKDNFKVIKNITLMIIFILLLIVFSCFLFSTKDNKLIKDIQEHISINTKVLYISNEDNYSDYPIEMFKKYDIDYLYIDSTKLSNVEKLKIENIINSKYLSNIIIIFQEGKAIDAIIEYESKNQLNEFLQKYELVPQIIGDNSNIITSVNELLKAEYALLYLPYEPIGEIDNQNKILKEISLDYGINYKKIDAYLLSKNQQKKLNTILQISTVEDQIVILIKDEEIIGSVRGINNKKDYLSKLTEYNFIDEIGYFITDINLDEFNNLISNNEKNVIIIGKDECKYCDYVIDILNDMAINYDIKINYINVGKIDSNIAIELEEQLLSLGYNDGFTAPITLMIENKKLLDYIIGASEEKYFIDIFLENGIIK